MPNLLKLLGAIFLRKLPFCRYEFIHNLFYKSEIHLPPVHKGLDSALFRFYILVEVFDVGGIVGSEVFGVVV